MWFTYSINHPSFPYYSKILLGFEIKDRYSAQCLAEDQMIATYRMISGNNKLLWPNFLTPSGIFRSPFCYWSVATGFSLSATSNAPSPRSWWRTVGSFPWPAGHFGEITPTRKSGCKINFDINSMPFDLWNSVLSARCVQLWIYWVGN